MNSIGFSTFEWIDRIRSAFDLRVFRFSSISYKCMRVLSYWVLRLLRSPQLWSVKIIFPRWFWSASSESGFYLSSKFNNLITRVWIWAGGLLSTFQNNSLECSKINWAACECVCEHSILSPLMIERSFFPSVVFEWKLREKKTPIPLTWCSMQFE